MKRTFLTLSLVGMAAVAFAQGKVSLQLDGGCAITIPPTFWDFLPGDVAFVGQAIPTSGPLPSGAILEVGLYAGTSSSQLTLTSTTLLNPVGGTGQPPGVIPVVHIDLPFAGGTLAYYQVKIWQNTYPSYEAAVFAQYHGAGVYTGENNIFTMTAGTTISYPAINNGGGTTWAAVGNEDPMAWNLGAWIIPEPSTFALSALGVAMLLMRRNSR